MNPTSDRIPDGERLKQIYEHDLDTCIEAVSELARFIPTVLPWSEHLEMLQTILKRVKDDYGPHTNVRIIE